MNKFPNERNCAQNIKESYQVYIMLITYLKYVRWKLN